MTYLSLLIGGILLTLGIGSHTTLPTLGGIIFLAIGVGRVIARHKVDAARRAEEDELRTYQLRQMRGQQPTQLQPQPDWRSQPPHGWPHNQ